MAKKDIAKGKEDNVSLEMYSYEEFCVAELLKEQNKGIDIESPFFVKGFALPPDLYSKDGIPSMELKGETVIEVKKNLSYAIVKETEVLYNTHGAYYNVVVVFFESSLPSTPLSENKLGKRLIYISFDELKGKKRLQKKEKAFYAAKAKNGDWKEEREAIVKNVQEVVKQGNNVLFLGAGVSASAKMPSWDELLKGLMGEAKQLDEPTLEAFKELNSHVYEECGNSNLIMGRYLQTAIKLYDDKADFAEKIQTYLYNENDTSELLEVLANIVQQKKVNEVITYNFDDLLEENLIKLNLTDSVDFTSIAKDAEIKGHNTLPIYHVHGIIPRKGSVDMVVFSEEEYHKVYQDSYHWSNVEQLHALSRMHCFFVGLSMNDPNLRRLLDIAQRMNRSNGDCHYAFLKRVQLEKYCTSNVEKTCKYVHVSDCLIDRKKQKEIYELNYAIMENIFMNLGVRVIWYEEYDELPALVAKVFGLTGFENKDAKELMATCESAIKDIKAFEDDYFKRDYSKATAAEFLKLFNERTERSKKYREDIITVNDILRELSNQIKWDEKTMQTILEMEKHVPKFDENISGYGEFYKVWLDMVKKFNR